MRLKTISMAFALLACSATSTPLLAYGSSGGSTSCAEARFYNESPARNSTVAALTEFSVTASDNTEMATLVVQINGEKVQPVVTAKRSGDFLIQVKLNNPLTQAGKARITLKAKSKEGCETFEPLYVDIKP